MFSNFKKTDAESDKNFGDAQSFSDWSGVTPVSDPAVDPENLFASNETAASYEPAPEVSVPMSSQGSVRNVLNSDVSVVGTLRFTDDLLVDGSVEGEIFSDGVLTVGTNASIQAEIKTKSAIIHGEVTGNVTVTDRVELSSTAKLVGDIVASTLSVQAGAVFIGRSTVGNVAGMTLPNASNPDKKTATKKPTSNTPDLLA